MEIKNCYTIRKIYINSIGIDFILIPPGKFLMGSESFFSDERPVHPVTISKPFFIGKYPVTQEQWEMVMGYNPSYFSGDNLPVENVSWYETQEFIQKLNQKENTKKYRLPTEAEWEYSCKGNTKTKWFFGDNESLLRYYAWYFNNSKKQTQPVGLKRPNLWGLYDMHGNVWEWCQDWYAYNYYAYSPELDPLGPDTKHFSLSFRIIRGGGWHDIRAKTRSTLRGYDSPNNCTNSIGFRLVKTL